MEARQTGDAQARSSLRVGSGGGRVRGPKGGVMGCDTVTLIKWKFKNKIIIEEKG